MAMDDSGLNANGLTADEQATFEGLYGPDAGAADTQPKPGTFSGWWKAAGAIPSALANVGLDVYGAANSGLRDAVDKLTDAHDFSNLAGEPEGYGMGTPFKAAPDTLRNKVDTAADETAQQVADIRSTADQMYRPDPHTTGAAGNLLFGTIEPLVRIGVGSLLTRGEGGLEFAAATQGYERTQELEAQGVDPGTAAASGAISAGTFEAMGAVGGEEGSLASRVLKSGAINFAGGITNRGADSEILKAAGYDKLAAQEQWNDAQTMISDALVGLAFPLVHEGINKGLDAAATRSENKLAGKIAANPELFDQLHDGTGYVPAANVDAALTGLNAKNAADTAPGIPTDFTSQGLHYKALDAAIKQSIYGDDVNVEPIVRGMNTIQRPTNDAKVDGISEALYGDTPIPAFNENDADIGASLRDRINGNFDGAARDYAALSGDFDTQGGRVLNTDLARELSPEYRSDRSRSAEVHEAASDFVKAMYQRKLAEPTPDGLEPTVLFTAGGTGAGKTTGLRALGDALGKPEIVYDTNMNRFESSLGKVRAALKAGRKVRILWTHRDAEDAFGSTLGRATRMAERHGSGRTVPIQSHIDTHVGVVDSMRKLFEKYANHPNVDFFGVDNSLGKGNHRQVEFADLMEKAENALRGHADRPSPDRAGESLGGARAGTPAQAGDTRGSERQDSLARSEQARGHRSLHGQSGRSVRDGEGLPGSGRKAARGRLTERLRAYLEAEHQAGRVSDRVYHGTLGTRPDSLNPAAGGVSDSGPGEPLHAWTPVDDTVSVPYAGGVSDDGETIYLDKRMPDTVEVDGKTIDAKEAVVLHERTEFPLMHLTGPMDDAQIEALKARIGDDGTVPEKSIEKLRAGESLTYAEAHQIATFTENHFVREKYGVDPEKYQSALTEAIAKARKDAPHEKDIPADLDSKPYDNIGEPQLLANKGAGGVESGTPSGDSTRGADAKANAGRPGEAGQAGPAESRGAAPDQEGRPGAGPHSAGDRDVARAREALARRPDLILPEGVTAAEAMRQADEGVAEGDIQARGIQAAIQCFLSYGSDLT